MNFLSTRSSQTYYCSANFHERNKVFQQEFTRVRMCQKSKRFPHRDFTTLVMMTHVDWPTDHKKRSSMTRQYFRLTTAHLFFFFKCTALGKMQHCHLLTIHPITLEEGHGKYHTDQSTHSPCASTEDYIKHNKGTSSLHCVDIFELTTYKPTT